VETVAAQHEVNLQGSPVRGVNDWMITEADRFHRGGEAHAASHGAKSVDQIPEEELLGIDVVDAAAQCGVAQDVPYASPAELTAPEGFPSGQHPLRQPVGLEQSSSAVFDQADPSPGSYGGLIQALQNLAVDPGPKQHIRGEEARRPSPDDPDSAN
jgi:hypothetical protein